MIKIENIKRADVADYWALHWEYLNRDIFGCETLVSPADDGDKAYFCGAEYRGPLEGYMDRTPDTAHAVYFVRNGLRIGCTFYITYKSEDGKCFILDYWVFPEYRGKGTGRDCFAALANFAADDGAAYFELNVTSDSGKRFWVSLGFKDDGSDEFGHPLMRLAADTLLLEK